MFYFPFYKSLYHSLSLYFWKGEELIKSICYSSKGQSSTNPWHRCFCTRIFFSASKCYFASLCHSCKISAEHKCFVVIYLWYLCHKWILEQFISSHTSKALVAELQDFLFSQKAFAFFCFQYCWRKIRSISFSLFWSWKLFLSSFKKWTNKQNYL